MSYPMIKISCDFCGCYIDNVTDDGLDGGDISLIDEQFIAIILGWASPIEVA